MKLSSRPLTLAAVLVALSPLSCASAPPVAEAPAAKGPVLFTYAPSVGRIFRHVQLRHEEMAIVGAPLRQAEDWEIGWQMTIETETNLVRVRADLKSLKLSHNGAVALAGDEVAGAKAFIELLVDKDGKIVDVRRTETISAAVVALTPPAHQEVVRNTLSPQNLRAHFISLAQERTADLLGHSAAVGETWIGEATPEEAVAAKRKLSVEAEQPCGKDTCVLVHRETEVNPELVWAAARLRVNEYVKGKGGDPSQVSLTHANIELQDRFLVNPRTLEFHHASFSQEAELSVATAEGALTVRFTTNRESRYEY